MFKVCFNPSSTGGDVRWLPGQASANSRKLLTLPLELNADDSASNGAQLIQAQMQHAEAVNHVSSNSTRAQKKMHAGAMPENLSPQSTPNAAYLAAHPAKGSEKTPLASSSTQGTFKDLPINITHLLQQPYAEPEAMHDRIGRVALANEHRKVIKQESSPLQELNCAHYVVYVGSSGQLMQAMDVSDFAPKSNFIPLQWPHVIEQMLVYTFAVSAALALINMAPIWYLDGEAALSTAVKLRNHSDIFYSSVTQPNRHWGRLLRCVLGVGSCIFICVLVLHMVRLLGYDAKLGQHLHTLGKLLSFAMT